MGNEILRQLRFDSQRGGLFYRDVRYLLIRPETLASFQRAIEMALDEEGVQILFDAGFHGGTLSAERYREVLGLSDEETARFMMNMGSQIGWGRFEVEGFDPPQKMIRVKVFHSPFAEAYGSSSRSVCHFIRGVMAGLGTVIFGENVRSEEPLCLAKGDSFCLFEVKGARATSSV